MAKTDQQFLEDRLGMTETNGWLDFIDDLKNLEESIAKLDSINSEKDLWETKGQLRVLNWIINLENAAHLALEELQEGNPT
jgi:hypothetical protein|tara:strand:+ start:64 stop:306 length:243 start_codon:yes stop_codon:yes gene_type:complete